LELATLGGARAMGLDKEIGSLELGKKADLAMVNLEGFIDCPGMTPTFMASWFIGPKPVT
jgi:cytosine/adenosine deaminase-related metal-dependent hydrolase